MSKIQKTSERQADAIGDALDRVLNNPNVEEHLTKICVDALTTFAAEAKEMTAEQFVFVPDLALTIYITALSHSATPADAERAVTAACTSLPTAIASANLVSEKATSTEDKLISKVTTASEMITRAAVSALPSLSKEDRDAIKTGIQSNINLSCFIQRKGEKFFDPKAGLDAYNIGWLKPVESKLSGSGGDLMPNNPVMYVEDTFPNMWADPENFMSKTLGVDPDFNPQTDPVFFRRAEELLKDTPQDFSVPFELPPIIDPPKVDPKVDPKVEKPSDFESTLFHLNPTGKFKPVKNVIEDEVIPAANRKQIETAHNTGRRTTPVTLNDLIDKNGNIDITRNHAALLTFVEMVTNPQHERYYKKWAALRVPEGGLPVDLDVVYKLALSAPVNSVERDDYIKAYEKLEELSLKTKIQKFDFKDPHVLERLTEVVSGPIYKTTGLMYKHKYPQIFENRPEIIQKAVETVAEQYANDEGYNFMEKFAPVTTYWEDVKNMVKAVGRSLLKLADPDSAGAIDDIYSPIVLPDSMNKTNIEKMAKEAMDIALEQIKASQLIPLKRFKLFKPPKPKPSLLEAKPEATPSEPKPEATPSISKPETSPSTSERTLEDIKDTLRNIFNSIKAPLSVAKWFGSYLWTFIKGIADISLKLLSYGKYGWKILKNSFEIAGIIFGATVGVKISQFMKTKYEDGSLGAKLQSVMRTVFGGAKAVSNILTSNPDINKRMKKITKAVKQLAPAMAQDYIAYQNRMRAYQDQQMYRKALFDRQEEQRRYDIQRQNAVFMANERRTREEALLHNKQELARQETDKKYLEELAKYHKKLEEAEKDFREKERKYLELQGKRQNDEASRQLLRQSRKEYANAAASAAGLIADIAGMVLSPPTSLATAAVGALGNAGAPAAPGAPGAQQGAYFNVDRLQNFADSADEYTRLAEQARQLGDFRLAQTYEQAADANLKHFHQIYDVSRSEMKSNEARFYKGLTSFGRLGSDLVHGISGLYFGKKDAEEAERLKNREVLIPPRKDYVGPAPLRAPYMPNLRYVPEEVKEDDPRLVKYVKHEYIPEPMPADMYSTPRTYQFVNSVPPKVKQKFSPGKGLSELPYVAPIPVMRVNPSSGAKPTLKTQVTPVYHPNTQIYLKGVPQKKARKH